MPRELANVAASVRDRLLNVARQSGRDYQLTLTHYALERLLHRLSASPHSNRFVLKGALLYTVWLQDPFRPTRDLDLLGHGDSDASAIISVFREILALPVEDDGVVFDVEAITAAPIREGARYEGIRVETTAMLGTARIPIQIDIGFGDVITPRTMEIEYPTALGGPAPRLRAYPRETVVAEKLEAAVSLGFANSRMKDFYDLFMLAQHFAFDGPTLVQAVIATFTRRGTAIPVGIPDGLSSEFVSLPETQARWRAFTTRAQLSTVALPLESCMETIRGFAQPVLDAAAGISPNPGRWSAAGNWSDPSSSK
jgi:predicted nucleotidyltransferase component of viral defense system